MEYVNGIRVVERTAPSTPAATKIEIYGKSDHGVWSKGSDGVERPLGSSLPVYDWVTSAYVLRAAATNIYMDPLGGHDPADVNGVWFRPATEVLIVALGDELTNITTGTAKLTMRMPYAMTLTEVRASLTVASSSGLPTFNIKESGSTIFSTKVTIDATELTSKTAATPAVISDPNLADDAQITFDIDVAGTGARGPKLYLIGYRA